MDAPKWTNKIYGTYKDLNRSRRLLIICNIDGHETEFSSWKFFNFWKRNRRTTDDPYKMTPRRDECRSAYVWKPLPPCTRIGTRFSPAPRWSRGNGRQPSTRVVGTLVEGCTGTRTDDRGNIAKRYFDLRRHGHHSRRHRRLITAERHLRASFRRVRKTTPGNPADHADVTDGPPPPP